MSHDHDQEDSMDPFEKAMREGYGGAPRGSVLACLEDRTGSVLRLTLPEPDDVGEPVVKPTGAEGAGAVGPRYQVLGEIARGGLGVVLKGRDLDLGRDVAVKVLHERYKQDRTVIERFVEEAQIGGQLQHPGIVPVYELGLQADDRPFFAMKLVRGETLAALLKKRRTPAEDLQRFLRQFLAVCQTVAYAHARGVVHRDLKPSNVLIGAFGEVQVVDWGLAKVLRSGGSADEPVRREGASVIETIRTAEGSTQSIAGSVMGTPAYMPPEQARGELGRMDTRSDVFSLGAILCEVLTGEPPYDAARPELALRAAAECAQSGAQERLTGCGADEELVELARACLAPAPASRPQDAEAVATRVEEHLQAVAARARRAEVRAAELRVRTRSLLAIASLVLVALVASGWAWMVWQEQRGERLADTTRRANAAIAEATRHAGQAEQAGLGGVALWGQASAAAERAVEIVDAGEADPALRTQVEDLLADMRASEDRTREEALREESHALLLERLREVRVGPDVARLDLFQGPQRRSRESLRRDADYAELFAGFGVTEGTPGEEVAGLVDCAHRQGLAIALDAWAEARRVAGLFDETRDPETWRALVRTARRLDPDETWRNDLRDELGRDPLDASGLRRLAAPERLHDRSPEEIATLVALLDAAGDPNGAVAAQREGLYLHPSDFWLNLSFANLSNQDELIGRVYQELDGISMRAALALRPGSRAARFGQAMMLYGEDRIAAIELLAELLDEDPGDPVVQVWHFMALMSAGRFDEAALRVAEIFPALQAHQVDWEYRPFVRVHGPVERMFETEGVREIMHALLQLELGRVDEAWATIEAHRGQIEEMHGWFRPPLVLDTPRSAGELRALVERLDAIAAADEDALAGASADELLAAAELCSGNWNRAAEAARLYELAFEREPGVEDRRRPEYVRYKAAFQAALASAGGGTLDPSEPERAALRARALAWLHEELDAIEAEIVQPDLSPELAERHSRSFHAMFVYGWLAPIREDAYLDRMPDDEAHACRVLWARVSALEAMLVDLLRA